MAVEIKGSLISELGKIENPTGDEMIPVETAAGNGYVTANQIVGKAHADDVFTINVGTVSDGQSATIDLSFDGLVSAVKGKKKILVSDGYGSVFNANMAYLSEGEDAVYLNFANFNNRETQYYVLYFSKKNDTQCYLFTRIDPAVYVLAELTFSGDTGQLTFNSDIEYGSICLAIQTGRLLLAVGGEFCAKNFDFLTYLGDGEFATYAFDASISGEFYRFSWSEGDENYITNNEQGFTVLNVSVSPLPYATEKYVEQNYAKKADLSGKVSGTGVTEIQVVTELPETQQDGVLYIVKEQEGTA